MKGDGMITLVTGGSGSGKSAYAEDVAASAEGTEKYYIATMRIYDAEGERKVERHRKLRAGKGFTTVESPQNIGQVVFPTFTETKKVCKATLKFLLHQMSGGCIIRHLMLNK